MSTTSTTTDHSLEDELFQVAARTTENGRVEVEIHEIYDRGEILPVEGLLPNGDTFREAMDYPEIDSREYKFVRLVEGTGLSLSGMGEFEGSVVEAEKVDGEWAFYAPEETTRKERLLKSTRTLRSPFSKWEDSSGDGFWVTFAFSPIIIVGSIFSQPFSATEVNGFYEGYSMAIWHLVLWALFFVFVLL